MERIGPYLAYVYLLRVPLLIWLFLAALPLVALPQGAPAETLLRGIFDIAQDDGLSSLAAFMIVTLTGLMAAMALGITAGLILLDGEERFGAGHIPAGEPGLKLALRAWALVPAVSLLAGACYQTRHTVPAWAMLGGAVLGGFFFWGLTKHFFRTVRDRVVRRHLFTPGQMGNVVTLVEDFSVRIAAALVRVLSGFVTHSPEGFVDPATRELRPRHSSALVQLVIALLVYAGLAFAKRYGGHFGQQPIVPTLCLVLVLAMLLCWGLTALTFYFDRFRVPLLLVLVIYSSVFSVLPQADSFYLSLPRRASPPVDLCPASVLLPRAGKPALVVAATGGGIQAAAWTARVLSGLKQDLQAEGVEFDESLRVISGVSGGSVGAMYFVAAYNRTLDRVQGPLDEYPPLSAAEASSLDEVAWGLTYPDLFWTLFPYLKGLSLYPPRLLNGPNLTSDRGSTLENAWKRTEGLKSATLWDWRGDVAAGRRPAAIFNATVVETGERFLLSTTDLDATCPHAGLGARIGRREFTRDYPEADVQVVTAARLSSTFPYVTPTARILRGGALRSEFHIVDGGYYDNYGVATLVEWLDQALSTGGPKPSKVLLVEIRSYPSAAEKMPGARGWLFQATHPLTALLNVRQTGQLSHNELDVHFVRRMEAAYGVKLETPVVFRFEGKRACGRPFAPPLSWHLTPEDKAALRADWDSEPNRRSRAAVREFFR